MNIQLKHFNNCFSLCYLAREIVIQQVSQGQGNQVDDFFSSSSYSSSFFFFFPFFCFFLLLLLLVQLLLDLCYCVFSWALCLKSPPVHTQDMT